MHTLASRPTIETLQLYNWIRTRAPFQQPASTALPELRLGNCALRLNALPQTQAQMATDGWRRLFARQAHGAGCPPGGSTVIGVVIRRQVAGHRVLRMPNSVQLQRSGAHGTVAEARRGRVVALGGRGRDLRAARYSVRHIIERKPLLASQDSILISSLVTRRCGIPRSRRIFQRPSPGTHGTRRNRAKGFVDPLRWRDVREVKRAACRQVDDKVWGLTGRR